MAAPTVTYAGNSNASDTGTTETITSVTWSAGDRIVVLGLTSDNTNTFTGTPAATGLTFSAITATTGTNPTNTGSSNKGYGWVATAVSGGTASITISGTAGIAKFIAAWVISGSGGVGNAVFSASGTGTTASLARSGANSGVVWLGGDWGATNDTTVTATPAGGNQRLAQFVTGQYTVFTFDWGDQGSAGTSSYGFSGFTTASNFTKIAVEILGTAGGGTDLTVTPGTPNVAWAGSTPAVVVDKTLAPGTPSVTWVGSTPAITADITRTPGTPNVAWSGSTPAVVVDKALTPGTPNVAWAGSTPAVLVDKTLTPGTAVVAWSGSTPSVILEGAVTLTPGTATVAWTGSTPVLSIVPDFVPAPPEVGGGDGGDGFEDFSTVEVRNLRLHPAPAVVNWMGSRAYVRVKLDPLRIRLPRFRKPEPVPAAPEPPRVMDLTLAPKAGSVAWAGSRARVVAMVPYADLLAEQERVADLERELEEEVAVLAALSAG